MTRSLPEDPLIRRLVQQARASQLTRRTVLAGGVGGAAALALAACSPPSSGAPSPATDRSDSDKTLNWANWEFYLDEDESDGSHPTLEAFEAETGIAVNYSVNIDANDTYYATVRDQLALGQDIGADIATLTDWMAARWIRFGYTQALDAANIPNLANLAPALTDPSWDPGRQHSLPWQGGFAGLVWRKDAVPDGLRTLDDLWAPDLAGRTFALNEMRDTMGLILLDEGIDISEDFTEDQFLTALDIFREKVSSGHVGWVVGNSYAELLTTGDAVAGIAWSGDVVALNAEAGEEIYGFAIPEAGGTIWNDNLLVPVGSPRKKNAEALINYYYEPEVAAEVALYVNYITPVVGAREAALEIDPEVAENWLIFPDEETLSNVRLFRSLSGAEEQSFSSAFQNVLVGV